MEINQSISCTRFSPVEYKKHKSWCADYSTCLFNFDIKMRSFIVLAFCFVLVALASGHGYMKGEQVIIFENFTKNST
jgi:hypothetical protein